MSNKFIFIEEDNTILNSIKNKLDWYKQRIESLQEENTKLKSEHYKDEELAKMKNDYDKLCEENRRGFNYSSEEYDKIVSIMKQWRSKHKEFNSGTIGGGWTYQFHPTSIGTAFNLIDPDGKSHTIRELS